jgi:hypothetical protein
MKRSVESFNSSFHRWSTIKLCAYVCKYVSCLAYVLHYVFKANVGSSLFVICVVFQDH